MYGRSEKKFNYRSRFVALNPNAFQIRLKNCRESYLKRDGHIGLTQKEAAAKLGVNYSTWRNWEKGRTKPLKALRMKIITLFPPLASNHRYH